MDDRLHVLGVRHHGPGSAALVRAALDRLDPAVVLIEGAPEGDALVPYAAHAGMKPPVAMLFYAAEDARAAIFAPFAEFSPSGKPCSGRRYINARSASSIGPPPSRLP
jgi:Family of unknown function (DUF5682)